MRRRFAAETAQVGSAVTWKLSDLATPDAAEASVVAAGSSSWCRKRDSRQHHPTTASTTTNKRSGSSRPRLVLEPLMSLMSASIAYTSGLTASDCGRCDHRRGAAPGLETPGPQAVVDLLSAGAGHHRHPGLPGRLQRSRRRPALERVLRRQLRPLAIRPRPLLHRLLLHPGPGVAVFVGLAVCVFTAMLRAPLFRAIAGPGYPLTPRSWEEAGRLSLFYVFYNLVLLVLPLAAPAGTAVDRSRRVAGSRRSTCSSSTPTT